MTASDLISGVAALFGGDDEGDDVPLAAAADSVDDIVEVRGVAWPRAQAARTAAISAERANAVREGKARVDALRAQLTAAESAFATRLRDIDAIDRTAREAIRSEIIGELREPLAATWDAYRRTASAAAVGKLGESLVHASEREVRELSGHGRDVARTVLVEVVTGRELGYSDVQIVAADRVVIAARSRSPVALSRALSQLDEVVHPLNVLATGMPSRLS